MAISLLSGFSLSSCSSVFYQPDRIVYFPPELNGHTQTNIYFKSEENVRIHAWFFEAKGAPKGTIVQFHGNAQNLSSHYATLVWLVHEGYNVFTFDYRGYGESLSAEDPDQKGVYLDGMAALKKAWELHQKSGAKQFIVYGQSLGGAVSMRCLQDFDQKEKVSLVVQDSTFFNYKDVAQETLANHWITWILSPLARILVTNEYATTEEMLQKFTTPLLVIHDENDPAVNFENGEKIFNLAGSSKKDLWKLNQGHHVGVFNDGSIYRKKFVEYLKAL